MHPIPAHRNHRIHLILNVKKVTMDWLLYAWNCYDDVAGVEEQLLVVAMLLAVMQIQRQQQMIVMVSNIIINYSSNISNMMQLHSTH